MANNDRISCGIDYPTCVDITSVLTNSSRDRYDFVCIPLMHPRYRREFVEGKASKRPGPFGRSDMTLSCQDWSSLIVGKISPWLDLDSNIQSTRRNSEKALSQELNWASHLALPAVMLQLENKNCYNLARCIYEHTRGLANLQYWVRVPTTSPQLAVNDVYSNVKSADLEDPWEWWDLFRTLSNRQKKINVCLELTQDLPSTEAMDRWYGEPIKAVLIPTSIFLTNKKGYPVFSAAHQKVITRLFRMDVQVIITGACLHVEKGFLVYQQYIEHLYKMQEPMDSVTEFAKGYEDYLQCPLQPLMDNLESQTYETFEKDPIKYAKYQEAVYKALMARVSEEQKSNLITVLMVVGAGRGPLVRASLAAAVKAERKIKVYAVEKNPNAVITLDNMQSDEWGEQVTIISCDMREWDAPEKADILVSELLGSFSDNELSPECLDGAQRFLKDDGISIPCSYTSWIAPLQAPKLHSEVTASRDKDKHPDTAFEMPYVVRLHTCQVLSKPVPVFTFTHPNKGLVDNNKGLVDNDKGLVDNERYFTHSFTMDNPTVMHGFSGYFDTVLYHDAMLSIVPETHSPGMFSWFPIFFPLKTPVHVKAGDTVTVHIWRKVTSKNVWYEWTITDPYPVPIHNPKGRSYTIGL